MLTADPSSPLARAGSFSRGFSARVYATLGERRGNVFVSPASLLAALGSQWERARGSLRRELASAMGLAGDEDANLAALAAQRDAWQDVGPNLLEFGSAVPGAELTSEAVSGAYFRGVWERAFDAAATCDADFTLTSGQRVSVPLMHTSGQFEVGIGKLEGTELRSVSLPFAGQHLTLLVALPEDPSAELPSSFERGELSALISRQKHRAVSLALPKLSLGWAPPLSARSALRALGARPALSDVTDVAPPVNPAGQFQLVLGETGAESPQPHLSTAERAFTLEVRRPFLFVIYDIRNGAIALMGRLLDPRGS